MNEAVGKEFERQRREAGRQPGGKWWDEEERQGWTLGVPREGQQDSPCRWAGIWEQTRGWVTPGWGTSASRGACCFVVLGGVGGRSGFTGLAER